MQQGALLLKIMQGSGVTEASSQYVLSQTLEQQGGNMDGLIVYLSLKPLLVNNISAHFSMPKAKKTGQVQYYHLFRR